MEYGRCECGKFFPSLAYDLYCKSFMETVQEVAESQGKKEENKDATDTADLLEKLSVGENKGDEKEKEEKVTAAEDKEAGESKAKTEADKEDGSASKA
ncbi:ran-binding protein c-like protein [Corchorus olitorius]|uniref:Ran-binding protein c-like protein n=1 Tax=Corchorus olitorius TaxID=93759 RepID=A0A1R3JRZ0_9ROSI|nr:ran-binding protein c-like protein [Corchorus olitorius]